MFVALNASIRKDSDIPTQIILTGERRARNVKGGWKGGRKSGAGEEGKIVGGRGGGGQTGESGAGQGSGRVGAREKRRSGKRERGVGEVQKSGAAEGGGKRKHFCPQ